MRDITKLREVIRTALRALEPPPARVHARLYDRTACGRALTPRQRRSDPPLLAVSCLNCLRQLLRMARTDYDNAAAEVLRCQREYSTILGCIDGQKKTR